MKKFVILSMALIIGSFAFAQTKEIKGAEKAIKNNNYSDALSKLSQAEGMLSSMDAKTKAKYYFLKGQALYANGAGTESDISMALDDFKMAQETETLSGKTLYTPKINEMKMSMANTFYQNAQKALEQKNYEVSAKNFERAYRVSSQDTIYLFNAALLATSAKSYDMALNYYNELITLGYTGIATQYFATETETGEEQSFPDAKLRDIAVMAGTHSDSNNRISESKKGEIAKNVALIYIEQGQNDKAMEAIVSAKTANPGDINLILAEANVRYKLGEIEKYKSLIIEALKIEPNNVDLIFNLGVVAAENNDFENAKMYYEKALKINPSDSRVLMNMAGLLLDQEGDIIDEMNNLGNTAADDKKFEELKQKRFQLYKDAIPYLTTILETEPNNLSAARTLMNIYSALDDMPNFNAMKAKIEEIEASGN